MLSSYILAFFSLFPTNVSKPLFSFSVVGDTQGGLPKRCSSIRRCKDNDWNRWVFPAAIKDMSKRKNLSFLVHLGDQETYGWSPLLEDPYYYLKRFKKRINLLTVPVYLTIGNHELIRARQKYHLYRINWFKWKKFWYYPSTYYYLDHKGYRFVVLDNSFSSVSNSQVKWFRDIMKSSKNGRVFIFSHRPFPAPLAVRRQRIHYYKYKNGKIDAYAGSHSYGSMSPAVYNGNGRKMWNVLKTNREKVAAMFCGHYHSYREFYLNGIGAPYYVSGGGGGTLTKKEDFHHYLIIHAYRSSVSVEIRFLSRGK